MTLDIHRQRHRRRMARVFVILMFLGFSLAEALLWYFTNHRLNPWPMLRGQVVGSALATTALLVALWQRKFWARYVLIIFVWYLVSIFGIVALVVAGEEYKIERRPVVAAATAVLIYVCINIVLICSHKIQHLARPPGSGGK